MSLNVYLLSKEPILKEASSGIFIRESGQTKEISMKQWIEKNPNIKPVTFRSEERETNEVYEANITHNLVPMAKEAGLYEYTWKPDEINIRKATELINPLREGLHALKSDPEYFKTFNPSNDWGDYETLVKFVEDYLNACYKYPDAEVSVSR